MDNLNENGTPLPEAHAVKEKRDRTQFAAGIITGALVMAIVMLIVVLMVIRHYSSAKTANTGFVSTGESVIDEELITKIDQIRSILDSKSIYDIDDENLKTGIIDGMLAATGDKYAYYYTAEEIESQMETYTGSFYGIGVVLFMDEGNLPTITNVYEDSPAEKAGFKSGDIIREVDGEDVSQLDLDGIVSRVRGEKGTKVEIVVWRESEGGNVTLYPVRDEIKEIVVEYEMKTDDIGYVHIEAWYDTTAEQFDNAIKTLESQGMDKGLIIDLRSNTGGLLNAAIECLDVCLPEEPVLYVEDNTGKRTSYNTYDPDEVDIPIVILTDGYTASASEIFTGAMKDYNKAISLGTETYGKGVVQSFYYLYDESAMKLTTEQYFTPNGTAIDGDGIDPDIEVKFDSESYNDPDNPSDNQLDAAIKYLNE
ncbi:MAG: S41 family peptidase [Lachnospiraceae bacterium]|nr:S41 family peptidase [Lachnospiraceae bacterium]